MTTENVNCTLSGRLQVGTQCLIVRTQFFSWQDAARFCEVSHKAELVRVMDEQVYQGVKTVMGMAGNTLRFWIGLTRLNGHGWMWTAGR